eukprot:tig00021127_g18825.t1
MQWLTNLMRRFRQPTKHELMMAAGVTAFALICIVIIKLGLIESLLLFIDSMPQGVQFLLIGGLIALFCILPLPGFFTAFWGASGFILGFWQGCLISSIGTIVGSMLAFGAGRKLLSSYVERKIKAYPKFNALNRAIQEGGLKVVWLFRMAPLPYAMVTILLSATPTKFWMFAVATSVDPVRLFADVYVGSQARDLHDLIAGKGEMTGPEKFALIFGLGLAIGVCVLISVFIARAMRKYNLIADPADLKEEKLNLMREDSSQSVQQYRFEVGDGDGDGEAHDEETGNPLVLSGRSLPQRGPRRPLAADAGEGAPALPAARRAARAPPSAVPSAAAAAAAAAAARGPAGPTPPPTAAEALPFTTSFNFGEGPSPALAAALASLKEPPGPPASSSDAAASASARRLALLAGKGSKSNLAAPAADEDSPRPPSRG